MFFSDLLNWTLDVERWTLSVLFMHGERRVGACLELVEQVRQQLKLARYPNSLAPTLGVYVDHSHCPVLAPAT